jgi:hypothetical protein
MRFSLRLTLPHEGELLCRNNNLGKKIPFVNSQTPFVTTVLVIKFPKFDN